MSGRLPPVALPLAPPRLTRNEAEGRSLVAQHVKQREVQLGGAAWTLSLEPLARNAEVALGANDWLVRADWAGAPIELRLPAAVAGQWLAGRFESLDLPALPEPVRAAALECALQDALDALCAAGQGKVRLDSVVQASAAAATPAMAVAAAAAQHRFALFMACADARIYGTLTTDALGLMLLAGVAAHYSPARGPIAHGSVPVLLRAEIGTATLPAAELRGLRPGDAIVLRHSFVDSGGQLWLGGRGFGLRVRDDGGQLVVTQPLHMTEVTTMDDLEELDGLDDLDHGHSPGTPSGHDAVTLDALPIRLTFDLGQRTMPLAELGELQVGQVVELNRPLSQAVSIRANGALIGTGELMEIGGRIAVGVTSLGPAPGAGA